MTTHVFVCRDNDAACVEVPVARRCASCPLGRKLRVAPTHEPSADDLLRAWKLNRWPAGLPRGTDWSDVDTAFRAGLFQGAAYAQFRAQPDTVAFEAGTVAEWREAVMANVMGLADEYAHRAAATDADADAGGCGVTLAEQAENEARSELEDALRIAISAVPHGVQNTRGTSREA